LISESLKLHLQVILTIKLGILLIHRQQQSIIYGHQSVPLVKK